MKLIRRTFARVPVWRIAMWMVGSIAVTLIIAFIGLKTARTRYDETNLRSITEHDRASLTVQDGLMELEISSGRGLEWTYEEIQGRWPSGQLDPNAVYGRRMRTGTPLRFFTITVDMSLTPTSTAMPRWAQELVPWLGGPIGRVTDLSINLAALLLDSLAVFVPVMAADFGLGWWRRRRRRQRGQCESCGYPSGASDRCSECGAV